jgi:hypothetical protein
LHDLHSYDPWKKDTFNTYDPSVNKIEKLPVLYLDTIDYKYDNELYHQYEILPELQEYFDYVASKKQLNPLSEKPEDNDKLEYVENMGYDSVHAGTDIKNSFDQYLKDKFYTEMAETHPEFRIDERLQQELRDSGIKSPK